MEAIWGESLPRLVHLIAVCVVCILVVNFAQYLFDRKITAITDWLRNTGTLPSTQTASDADILRLVRDGLHEEAALLYKSLHKGTIEKAKLAVGLDISREQYTPILWFAALAAIGNVIIGIHLGELPLFIFGVLFAAGCVLTALYQRKLRKTAEANRAMIEAGILPSTGR
jgi:Flp pilus assembly protein TadB